MATSRIVRCSDQPPPVKATRCRLWRPESPPQPVQKTSRGRVPTRPRWTSAVPCTPEFLQKRSYACPRLDLGPRSGSQKMTCTTRLALDLIWNVPVKQGTGARVSPLKLSIADAFARDSPQPLVASKENLPYHGPPTDRNLRLPVGCSCYADERRSLVCNNHVLFSNLRDLPQQRSQTT